MRILSTLYYLRIVAPVYREPAPPRVPVLRATIATATVATGILAAFLLDAFREAFLPPSAPPFERRSSPELPRFRSALGAVARRPQPAELLALGEHTPTAPSPEEPADDR